VARLMSQAGLCWGAEVAEKEGAHHYFALTHYYYYYYYSEYPSRSRPPIKRNFSPEAPDRLWVAER
jgi:hypothetical protein